MGEIKHKQQNENALKNFQTKYMDPPSKMLGQIAFNTRPKIEENMLIVMDKSTHEAHLSQPLQTNIKQFKIAVSFLTGYNGIFNVTNSKNRFLFNRSITDEDGYIHITLHSGSYEIEVLIDEIKRIIIEEAFYTKFDYPFIIKPNFSTLGSIIEISTQKPVITFTTDDSIGDLLRVGKTTIYEAYNLTPNPVDIILFDKTFLECNIAQGMI